MPVPKWYGEHPPITGDRQVSQPPSTKAAVAPIETDRWFRIGKHPDAKAMNLMNAGVNSAMLYRTKSVFDKVGLLGSAAGIAQASSATARTRWRFAFHTSPYTHALFCRAVMYPQKNGFEYDAYANLRIYSDAAESTLVSTTEFHYGSNPLQSSSLSGWQYLRIVDKFVEGLTADTTYYAVWSEFDYGLTQSLAVGDIQSMSENYDGYLPVNFTEETQILDKYRENLVTAIPPMWKRGGAKILNWTADRQGSPRTSTSASATNLIDASSTTYGSSIPGFTLDMTGKARLSQSTGVPFVMQVAISCTSASNGVVHLRDSAGTIVATCTNTYGVGVLGWVSGSGVLPATNAKYYLTYQTAAGTVSVYAASLYEYET
jgi:hypothetical protein